MLRQARSGSTEENVHFTEFEREGRETNTQWGARAVAHMKTGGSNDWTYIVLLGGSDSMSFRVRVAQSHLRSDMLPSYWSQALLVELTGDSVANANAIHVPLLQPDGPEFAARTNGVVVQPLSDFDDPVRFPNIAVVAIPVAQSLILKCVESFRRSRPTLDALEHVVRWLAFAWGAARTPNPLHENYGLPSSCMLETVCAAANFDLTPGLESRASCPEAIWATARYWQKYIEKFSGRAPAGRYWRPHRYPITEPDDATTPRQPARKSTRTAKRK
ncbi:hypothetical protein J2W23_004256 [Variovorax boronicumulans]|uniref:hypothetical protein n=1 Tax=Variovorax boronicumulans TaxID=436515 RepID=UPI002789D5AC|nr:hypothetical protein [Variovorax boronicumulans]MDQ0015855.1 hypothetical protein [Variovorax boronicumulans]